MNRIGFVRDLGERKTSILWSRVFLFIATLTLGTCLALVCISYLFDVESQWKFVLPQVAAAMVFLIIAIEAQRQRILVGKWSWRFSLGGIFWITLFVAVFISGALNIAYSTEREFAFGQKVIEAVQQITKSGNTYSQSRGGRFVVVVTRTDFSDSDLANVIKAATKEGERASRIVSLVIWGTAVTDQGLANLENCPKLEVLSTSVGPFSEAVQSKLTALRKLRESTLDDSKFTQKELLQLRSKIPKVLINGR